MKRTIYLVHDQARKLACELAMTMPDGYAATFQEPSRSIEQNAYQWPYLEGFSRGMQWPVNGKLEWLSKDEWKDVLTSAFENEVNPRIAAGFDGGVVMLGRRTSKYGKKKFADWMTWLMAAAAMKGIEPVFSGSDKRWE